MNSIFSFYNYIADYTDRNGKDFHNEFSNTKISSKRRNGRGKVNQRLFAQ